MAFEFLVQLTEKLIWFFLPEVLILAFLEKKGSKMSFRFSGISSLPFLGWLSNPWIVIAGMLGIGLFTSEIFEAIYGLSLDAFLNNLGFKIIYVFGFLISFSMLWGNFYFLERRKFDTVSYMFIALLTVCVGLFLLAQ